MEDYELWVFECYAKMCKSFNIKSPPELIIVDNLKSMGLHTRVKYGGYMSHSKRFYRKYVNLINKYIADQYDCSILKVKKSGMKVALENKKLLLKIDKIDLK